MPKRKRKNRLPKNILELLDDLEISDISPDKINTMLNRQKKAKSKIKQVIYNSKDNINNTINKMKKTSNHYLNKVKK